MKQRTVSKAVELSGTGLHSGTEVTMSLQPAELDTGIVFRRTDVEGRGEVPATVANVAEVERGTVLRHDGVKVRTVEHVLSALAGLQIDNLVIELDGEEPPVGDGSAAAFVELLQQAGTKEQGEDAAVFECTTPFAVNAGDSHYAVFPDDSYGLSVSIDFDHPLIRRQHAAYRVDPETFEQEIGPARTFGFFEDAEKLRAAGLALGASVENTVVLTSDGLYEGVKLRYDDEFVRHKALDLIGDLALVGTRIKGRVVAERPGHLGNIALAREMAERARRQRTTRRVDISQIFQILPHRYPFLLVDRVVEYERAERIVGIKNVTINEPFFVGHFPGLPIMPGVLIIEAMAQVGGLLLMDTVENPEDKIVYFMSLDKVKFRRPVIPGDQIEFELRMLQMRRSVCRMKGIGRVDGQVVAEAEMAAQVVDR
ncbi:MAG: bifunctional UDP-3-O-[3-hydroxymyristoyl] N-acetylglucosamine deacetylase/3-hydroxyacyl-ACP dehydratase [Gemmatimonadetes bacterium]|uniref:Multifunctional fusion protein n=1 Tax=Candidatus Kutchimonas denitrificans TaxID=3056748 RepID=A0AAE4Z9R6_9BACT|nr:bifunctional UDP-3-O-[3-hydroxymyristoyl] N-acetylglucosamine deacetylase/3-hydroxyacyl-ACP dehydratase [Gemmatimonadota bacterium]NIR75282.1 bifunctional UDP-3-O-[3-hydroxymyristoyl] N-acetylglucosamine deacetylase/3-hydroxyacyl-ACP dehydratase [Candidatus Kutchimonas denitrificans]NIS00220.1 bifunctional UDP-3-O-[3-hydroxymyristoyl] N-acetylglucosamine deacetylase/3-hydroxyacyl-ACP dehydratase [Gemmatimonadota bacterium]NIT65812.1 bifunctional UDP-3-O-[3-hydroxymyristoyl] N-acetylglucosamin